MARAGDIVCRCSTGEMEEQWGVQEFSGRVEWEGGGFERFQEESESVSSLFGLFCIFLSVLDKESISKVLANKCMRLRLPASNCSRRPIVDLL